MACVMTAPSEDMRIASQEGTRPPCKGRIALPVRFAIESQSPGSQRLSDGRAAARGVVHGSKRYRVPRRRDSGNAVLPYIPRGAGHHVERARIGIQREPVPRLAGKFAEPQFTGGYKRKAENPVKMRLVAVPANADTDVILRAKNLLNPGIGAAERFDLRDDLVQPGRDRLGPLQLPQGVIVSETERSDSPPALELSELKGLKRKVADPGNELLFDSGGTKSAT
jgi:hypothetical protein